MSSAGDFKQGDYAKDEQELGENERGAPRVDLIEERSRKPCDEREHVNGQYRPAPRESQIH